MRSVEAVMRASAMLAEAARATTRRPLAAPEDCSVLVTGVARDCGPRLSATIERLRNATSRFRSVAWLVVESDSGDDTVDRLAGLAERIPDFAWRSLGVLRTTMRERTERIAHCRNVCVHALATEPRYRDVDLVIVADLDDANPILDASALLSCWQRDDWDVCCANQRGPYYDIWALRHPLWCPNDWWRLHRFLTERGIGERAARDAAMSARMITIPESADWIPVDSAFGGLAVYRREAIVDAHYTGLDADGEPICEHVPMHAALVARGFRIFINPRLVNAAWTSHTDHLAPLQRLRRRARNGLLRCWSNARGLARRHVHRRSS